MNPKVDKKYIYHINGRYIIQKRINGRTQSYGSFTSFEEAVKYRDYCIQHDWDFSLKRNPLPQSHKKTATMRIAKMFGVSAEELL